MKETRFKDTEVGRIPESWQQGRHRRLGGEGDETRKIKSIK